MNKVKRPAKPVDFLNNEDDHACLLYASLGFSTSFICRETGLSECQVSYRLQKAGFTLHNGLSRTDFRNGTSPFARAVLSSSALKRSADAELGRQLKATGAVA